MVALDEKGAIVLREKISRSRIAARLVNVPQCLIGIEAGMASHHVARELLALGHEVKQLPPAYAIPFRQGHNNDFRDAHAVAEAVQRPSTRCVPTKTDSQLDLQPLHRVTYRLRSSRRNHFCCPAARRREGQYDRERSAEALLDDAANSSRRSAGRLLNRRG
jgi:transposase